MNNIPATVYLLFQIFIAGVSSSEFPRQGETGAVVRDISSRIGITGNKRRKLGFVVGPISFNQNDSELRRLIAESFDTARKTDTAVAFHIDDSMFWDKRDDLIRNKANLEWIDWSGRECTGRRLDWGPKPTKVAPQMCFNSEPIRKAVSQRAHLIGSEIKRQLDRLRVDGREELFAGIIAGWETQMGHDFDTNRSTGYHALANAGFRSTLSAEQCDVERVRIVKQFIEMWTRALAEPGIPPDKIYSHIAFTSQGLGGASGQSYAQQVGFAEPSVAFSRGYRPGFSTYPEEGALDEICKQVSMHDNPPWISAEGTNVVPTGMKGEPTMESYLGKMFNHGAVMVNIFSWGMGGEAERNNFFRRATESEEAISAYRKFLAGKALQVQARPASQFSARRLQEKIHAIQSQAPLWVQRTRRPDILQGMMMRLDEAIKANRFEEADKIADELLKLLNEK